jgi:hypothetical protein
MPKLMRRVLHYIKNVSKIWTHNKLAGRGLDTSVIQGYMKDILSLVLFKPFSDLANKNIKGASY